MKQTAVKTPKRTVSPALKTLTDKVNKADQAAEKAYADFEKKQSAYKETVENESAKNVLFQAWTAVKIARLTYKIKRAEYKLAKSNLRFAKKAAKKDDQKTGKEVAATVVPAPKPKVKKVKETKKTDD